MIILAIPLVMLLIGIYCAVNYETYEWWHVTGVMLASVGACVLFIMGVVMIVEQEEGAEIIAEHAALKSYFKLIDDREDIELSLTTRQIFATRMRRINSEINFDSAHNDGVLDWWCHDGVAELEVLK